MKFKKAGNVFEDIGDAFRAIEKVGGMSRHEDRDAVLAWVYAHPAEAARLMGYEVVKGTYDPCDHCMSGSYRGCDGCGYADKKEANFTEESSNEVNQEIQQEEEPMKQDKPLSEWTLGEIQQHCNKTIACFDCKFTGICFDNASDWDLTEEPRFTEEEVVAADAAETLYQTGLTGMIEREEGNGLWLCCHGKRFPIPTELFPSILPGTSVKLSEIVGEVDL